MGERIGAAVAEWRKVNHTSRLLSSIHIAGKVGLQ